MSFDEVYESVDVSGLVENERFSLKSHVMIIIWEKADNVSKQSMWRQSRWVSLSDSNLEFDVTYFEFCYLFRFISEIMIRFRINNFTGKNS